MTKRITPFFNVHGLSLECVHTGDRRDFDNVSQLMRFIVEYYTGVAEYYHLNPTIN